MLHVLLLILKIIGIILLVLIGLILLIILSVLFIPIRYQLSAEKEPDIKAKIDVGWLLRLVHVQVMFQDKKLSYYLKIAGHAFLKNDPPSDNVKEMAAAIEEEEDDSFFDADLSPAPVQESFPAKDVPKESDTIPDLSHDQVIDTIYEEPASSLSKEEHLTEPEVEDTDDEPPKEKISIKTKIHNIYLKAASLIRDIQDKKTSVETAVQKLKKKVQRIYRFLTNHCTKAALHHLKQEAFYLLRHFLPRTIEGSVHFGFDDPALTGKILGYIYAFNAFTGNHLNADADFEQKLLDGNLHIAGHVRACHVIKSGIALVLDRNIRITIKRLRKLRG